MKRKYKLLIIITIGFILSLLLYLRLNKQNNTLLFVGDSLLNNKTYESGVLNILPNYTLNKEYLIGNITTSEMYNLINKNISSIQKDIHEAKVLVLSIGYQELQSGANIRMYLYYLEKIIVKLKELNNNQIYLISMPTSEIKYQDINTWLKNIALKYNIEYLTIS